MGNQQSNQVAEVEINKDLEDKEPKLASVNKESFIVSGAGLADGEAYRALLHEYQMTSTTLGEGGFGKVRLATSSRTGHQAAVKIVRRNKLNERAELLLKREVAYHEKLRHPNIVRLFTWIKTPSRYYLVMEYCDRGDLLQHINANDLLPTAEVRSLFSQLLHGLRFCHSLGVFHRDLKLENLMLCTPAAVPPPTASDAEVAEAAEGEAADRTSSASIDMHAAPRPAAGVALLKIADFGLSTLRPHTNHSATHCGSPLYAAPELMGAAPALESGGCRCARVGRALVPAALSRVLCPRAGTTRPSRTCGRAVSSCTACSPRASPSTPTTCRASPAEREEREKKREAEREERREKREEREKARQQSFARKAQSGVPSASLSVGASLNGVGLIRMIQKGVPSAPLPAKRGQAAAGLVQQLLNIDAASRPSADETLKDAWLADDESKPEVKRARSLADMDVSGAVAAAAAPDAFPQPATPGQRGVSMTTAAMKRMLAAEQKAAEAAAEGGGTSQGGAAERADSTSPRFTVGAAPAREPGSRMTREELARIKAEAKSSAMDTSGG